ncbi:hypothetical protein GAY33_18250 [Azospirillum brasilense]|uniref:tetratricopeptide repeat protein n=1 Tax=Azospirillum argentinense TaxID=2970906 RepID=UPI00190EED8F|nr:hypothetical protein [Azospirillum argentinense]MBK3801142.1 hypothetical protein [Azospirillum argentinense]
MPRRHPVTFDPLLPNSPTTDEVRAELAAILSSTAFESSQRRRDFLRFIVEETLAGHADTLKGFTIAVGVFGRDDSFDPQTDPVVRLEAGRLRRDLDSYYVAAGRNNAVRISIPKGSYVPRFERNENVGVTPAAGPGNAGASSARSLSQPPTSAAHLTPWTIGIAAILLLPVVLGVIAGLLRDGPPQSASSGSSQGPALMVLPFDAFGDEDIAHSLANGLAQELIGNLIRFPGFRLYVMPLGAGDTGVTGPKASERDPDAAYVVRGSVRAEGEHVRVAAQLSNTKTGQVLWANSYDRQLIPGALIRAQRDLASEIATILGQPYGVVNRDLLQEKTPAVSTMQSYLCVQRAYIYRRSFSQSEFAPVHQCLEESVQRDPAFSEAWAMLGWLRLDHARLGSLEPAARQREYELAFQAASRAVAMEPDNTLALKALSSINHYMGHYEESERLARRAMERNPNDPDTLAQLGWRLAVRGRFDEGIPMLKQAIERTVNPPGWYYHLIAIDLYLQGRHAEALQVAERSATSGLGVSQALSAIAQGALGNREGAQKALAQMATFGALARDPAAYFRLNGATEEIVDALMKGLNESKSLAGTQ